MKKKTICKKWSGHLLVILLCCLVSCPVFAASAIEYYGNTGIAVLQKAGQPASSAQAKKYGWKRDNTDWYYLTEDGKRLSGGWVEIDSKWFCFDQKGYIRTGWIQSGYNWYYCDASDTSQRGVMLTNQYTPDGYYVNEKGAYVP